MKLWHFMLVLWLIIFQFYVLSNKITTFDEYIAKYPDFSYCSSSRLTKSRQAECDLRRTIFDAELKDVQAHNDLNLGWQKGSFNQQFIATASSLPANKSVDWRTLNVVTPVKNQGGCGSCWAFASTEVIESFAAIQSGVLDVLSTQQVTACTPNPQGCGGSGGCGGATQELGFAYVAGSDGLVRASDYPYTGGGSCHLIGSNPLNAAPAVQVAGYVTLPANDYLALMNAVALIGPVTISIDATILYSYKSGILKCHNNWDINHAVQLVGYGADSSGNKYWILRNSWGADFGENGYFRLARSDSDSSNCGVDLYPSDGSGCRGGPPNVTVCGSCGMLSDSSYPTGVHLASTRSPTIIPSSKASSVNPTSSQPSYFQTYTPSASPTSSATHSLIPSVSPSTARPFSSSKPTVLPSTPKPSPSPSANPTSPPSAKPSAPPSAKPSAPPSVNPPSPPSASPSSPPSGKPSPSPSSTRPSANPSLSPSSAKPSAIPHSVKPSLSSTAISTIKPSATPTRKPSGSHFLRP